MLKILIFLGAFYKLSDGGWQWFAEPLCKEATFFSPKKENCKNMLFDLLLYCVDQGNLTTAAGT